MVVRRGGCSYTDKLLAAAAAGARGVVVVNTDEAGTSPMQGAPEEAALIQIPVGAVGGGRAEPHRHRDL